VSYAREHSQTQAMLAAAVAKRLSGTLAADLPNAAEQRSAWAVVASLQQWYATLYANNSGRFDNATRHAFQTVNATVS